MLRGGRGSSLISPLSCDQSPSVVPPTRPGLWPVLLPGQRWRLLARRAVRKLTRSHGTPSPGSTCSRSRGVQCHALPPSHHSHRAASSPYQDGGSSSDIAGLYHLGVQHNATRSAQPTDKQHEYRADSSRATDARRESSRNVHTNDGDRAHGTGSATVIRSRSAWISTDDAFQRRGGRAWGSPRGTAAPRPLPAALSDEGVAPLMRKAERDTLPNGEPNTPWRRIAYQIRLAPSVSELLELYCANRGKGPVWRPHLTALVITKAGALLYPRAVAATVATVQAGGHTDGVSRFPPAALKSDAVSLFESLSGKMNKVAVRQVQGMSLARMLVTMGWMEVAGPKCEALVAALISELQRQRGGKLSQVALVDPPLFGRLVRMLAQLAPSNRQLWVDLQRITMAALLAARADAQGEKEGQRRLWAGPGRHAAEVAELPPPSPSPLRPKPDCTTADLANMAFGFAAANSATPSLFAALCAAVLLRELPADPDALARLLCAWGRARISPGPLLYRIVDAFVPLLDSAPPRPIGRLLWSLGMMGVRDERFLCAAAKAIVGRQLVFSSPQELVNVVWAYSQLGWQVEKGAEPIRPAASAWVEAEMRAARTRPRGVLRQPPAPLREGEAAEELMGAAGTSAREGDGALGREQDEEGAESGQRWRSETAAASSNSSVANTVSTAARRRCDGSNSNSSRSGGTDCYRVSGGAGPSDLGAAAGERGKEAVISTAADVWLDLKPLPISAPLASAEQARQAQLQPLPDYPEHFALYRYMGRSFIRRAIGTSGGGGGAHNTISHSQLATLVGSFARAGYRSKQLFYTMSRIALLRIQFLSPADLTLILSSHARLRIPHTGLFEAACPLVAAKCCEYTPAQLAETLWAVQTLMPDAYVQLASQIRVRRGWLPPQSQVATNTQGEPSSPANAFYLGRGSDDIGVGGDTSAVLPSLVRLRVPQELLDDADWIDAEEGDGLHDDGVWHPTSSRFMEREERLRGVNGVVRAAASGRLDEMATWRGETRSSR